MNVVTARLTCLMLLVTASMLPLIVPMLLSDVKASPDTVFADSSDVSVTHLGSILAGTNNFIVGDLAGPDFGRGFLKFSLAGLTGKHVIGATLSVYLWVSTLNSAIDTTSPLNNPGLGDLQGLHIDDYGTLDAGDFNAASIGNDPGVLIPSSGPGSTPNAGYVSIDVTPAMQADIDAGRPFTTYMLKMAIDTDGDNLADNWSFYASEVGASGGPKIDFTTAGAPDFSITSPTSLISLTQGSSGSGTITVTSLNAFSAQVALTASWVGTAPSGVNFALPSPITPLPSSTANSQLTITAAPSASTGIFRLRVTGTSGVLTHDVVVGVEVTGAATTTGTTTTPSGSKCLIATATFGSELSPEVQFLRNFRDNSVLKTYAGSSFMMAFNTWYYSFSPSAAQFIAQHPTIRTGVKFLLYSLIGILRLGSAAFELFPTSPEAAVVLSGLVVSMMIGAVYAASPVAAILSCTSRGRRIARRLEKPAVVVLMFGFVAVGLAEVSSVSILMIIATSTSVLAILILSTLLVSRTLLRILERYWGQ